MHRNSGDWGAVAMWVLILPEFVPGIRKGYYRRIWNWPFQIGLGSWALASLLSAVLHGGAVTRLCALLAECGLLSWTVFVVGFLVLMFPEGGRGPGPAPAGPAGLRKE